MGSSIDNIEEVEVVRKIPKYTGIYIKGEVEGVDVLFTVDTGATLTVVSNCTYNSIPKEKRPRLEKTASKKLANADGKPINYSGHAMFCLFLGQLNVNALVTVADIEDDVLLGADILMGDPSGPADILLSEGRMVLRDTSVPLENIGIPCCARKVVAADNYVIPGMSETIIDVFVNGARDTFSAGDILVEASPTFAEDHALVLAPCLVDSANNATVKVRVLNPFNDPVSIRQDTVIGQADNITEIVHSLCGEEHEEERMNYENIRRIQLQSPMCAEKLRGVQVSMPHMGDCQQAITTNVPPHLEDLYQESIQSRSQFERTLVAELLTEFSDTFSKNEYDLGRTQLAEHIIDTGDARPIKQPPRRIPMAFTGGPGGNRETYETRVS